MSRSDFVLVEEVSVDDILLDVGNARIRDGHDQADCLSRILRKQDQLMALMADIAERDLTTMPILVKPTPEGEWIVMDGNRRVTALKLLNDPTLCPVESLKPAIRALKKKYGTTIPARVDVLSSNDDAAIAREVLARHSGAQGGAGQLDWSAYLRTVYLLNHGHPPEYKRPGQYAMWAERHGIWVDDEFPISSLQRFFTQENLELLGFKVEQDEIVPALAPDVVKSLAQTVLTDFATTTKVDDVRTPEKARSYIMSVRSRVGLATLPHAPAPSSSSSTGSSPAASPAASTASAPRATPGSAASTATTETHAPSPAPRASPSAKATSADRNRLFGRGSPNLQMPETETKARTIVAEIRKLDVKETPLAVGMLFRALIEISDRYYRAENQLADKQGLAKNVRASADKMLNASKLSAAQHDIVLRYTSGPATLLQIETLQKMIHQGSHHPDSHRLNTMWDELGAFIRACWAK